MTFESVHYYPYVSLGIEEEHQRRHLHQHLPPTTELCDGEVESIIKILANQNELLFKGITHFQYCCFQGKQTLFNNRKNYLFIDSTIWSQRSRTLLLSNINAIF